MAEFIYEFSDPVYMEDQNAPTVWIVEDSQLNRRVVVFAMQELGFRVLEFANGHDAIGFLKTAETPPELIMCDLMMPNVSGFDVMRAVREKAGWENVPLVVISAVSERGSVERAKVLRVASYLLKPLSAMKILESVKRVVPHVKLNEEVVTKLEAMSSPNGPNKSLGRKPA